MPRIVRVMDRRSSCPIPSGAVEDERLSWTARGVLAYLLAKRDGQMVRVSDLQRRGELGREGVYRILEELQRHGYVRLEVLCAAEDRPRKRPRAASPSPKKANRRDGGVVPLPEKSST